VSIGRGEHTDVSASGSPLQVRLEWGRAYNLWIYDVGLACCAVEFVAATMRRGGLEEAGASADPPALDEADVLVVSGTVTDKMAPAIKRLYDRLPEPRYVISFGSCANCGGPYWDSYCVTKGVDQIIPVDVYVPGCPPRPEALLDGLAELNAKVMA
jgi:NADH-quinone oxidoreductase subunit B